MKKSDSKSTKTYSSKTSTRKTSKPDGPSGLRELFEDELKDAYWAEKELTKAIPKMVSNASASELVDALTNHLEETKNQVKRLEEVFSTIGEKAVAKKCDAMAGLTKEGEDMMKETEAGAVRDAAIISAAQKIEHYEIATYGTLASFARVLGEDEAAQLLETILEEEKNADQVLSELSESINIEAYDFEMEDDK